MHGTYISKKKKKKKKKGFLEECDKEENVALTGDATTSRLKTRLKRVVRCHAVTARLASL